MGHWSERLLEEAARAIGIYSDVHGDRLRTELEKAGREIELLAGRQFGVTSRRTVSFLPQPFPFVEIPDLQVGTMELNEGTAWTVPDPVNQQMSTVIQTAELRPPPAARPRSTGDALWVAGNLAARERRDGRLSADYVIWWLGTAISKDQRMELLRAIFDDNARFNVPVLGVGIPGWWIQITRRLFWVTDKTPDEGRLLEPLFEPKTSGEEKPAAILAAGEPVLILARVTTHPVNWALTARIWTDDVKVADQRPWRILADAIHGSGIPIMTVDEVSTDEEVGGQLLLLAYWHGYITADEDGLVEAMSRAYRGPVGRIRAKTDAPNMHAAAAMLLGLLLHPGFDPAKGAAATRRYVNRLASIVVMEHSKAMSVHPAPWERLGIKERHYYKLLRRLRIPKVAGRYQVDDRVITGLHAYLDRRESETPRQAAKQVLLEHGFSEAAARKWLQRHPLREALHAWPRQPAGGVAMRLSPIRPRSAPALRTSRPKQAS